VAVVGSVNLDIVARVEQCPVPGETVTDAVVNRFPGGKGANQAIAAHRLGAQVHLLACVGDDPAAEEALASLRAEGVCLDHCRTLQGIATGLALILLSASGENQIVVAPGANAAFAPRLLDLPLVDAVIAQLEVPMETVLQAAQERQGFFCLNAAPAKPLAPDLLQHIDLLVVNEVEARTLGRELADYRGWLAVTHGSRGAVLNRQGREVARATPPVVEVVDTTGAGDAFTAALTVALASGQVAGQALQQACAAGALTATRHGAQSSPRQEELVAFFSA